MNKLTGVLCRVMTGLAVAVVLYGCGPKAQELKMRFSAGDTRTVRLTDVNNTSLTLMGQNMDQSDSSEMVYTFTVENVGADGTATIKAVCDSARVSSAAMNAPGMPDLGEALQGQAFTMEVTPTGAIPSFSCDTDVVAKVMEKLAPTLGQISQMPGMDVKGMMEEGIRKRFGEDALRQRMLGLLNVYPDKPVAVGDSWTKQTNLSDQMPTSMPATFTLKKREKGKVEVEAKAEADGNTSVEVMRMGPMVINASLKGTRTSTLTFDEATGWLAKNDGQFAMEGAISMSGAPGGGEGMPVKISGTSTVETSPR